MRTCIPPYFIHTDLTETGTARRTTSTAATIGVCLAYVRTSTPRLYVIRIVRYSPSLTLTSISNLYLIDHGRRCRCRHLRILSLPTPYPSHSYLPCRHSPDIPLPSSIISFYQPSRVWMSVDIHHDCRNTPQPFRTAPTQQFTFSSR